jgi:hypothetical protein
MRQGYFRAFVFYDLTVSFCIFAVFLMLLSPLSRLAGPMAAGKLVCRLSELLRQIST